jgi:Lon protease-like protein
MPLPLRVFEERYLVMLAHILQEEPAEFGVVLIERGQEVGGGEQRFLTGTVARITQVEAAEGFIALIAEGDRRIEVVDWVDGEPYPQAEARELPDLEWRDSLQPLRDRAEQEVRRALAVASEFSDQQWSATVEISDDPIAAVWQLAAIAPLTAIDQITLLKSTTTEQLLISLIGMTADAAAMLGASWEENGEFDDPIELASSDDDEEEERDNPADDNPADDWPDDTTR